MNFWGSKMARFVGSSAIAIFSANMLPVLQPNSFYGKLILGVSSETHQSLKEDDQFLIHAKNIARRLGVRHVDKVQILLATSSDKYSAQVECCALGADLVAGFGGISLVIPDSLYTSFNRHQSGEKNNVLFHNNVVSMDQINFMVAHEFGHVANNHSIHSASFIPFSLVSVATVISRFPNPFFSAILGIGMLIGGNIIISWKIEHEADHLAGKIGFSHGGIEFFEEAIQTNNSIKRFTDNRLITDKGDYLGDIFHPLLSKRLLHMKKLAENIDASIFDVLRA